MNANGWTKGNEKVPEKYSEPLDLVARIGILRKFENEDYRSYRTYKSDEEKEKDKDLYIRINEVNCRVANLHNVPSCYTELIEKTLMELSPDEFYVYQIPAEQCWKTLEEYKATPDYQRYLPAVKR
jgi:ribosomal 30S subunit maturation factor RimM